MAGHTSGTIADLLGAELLGRSDLQITRLDAIARAGAGALTFIRSGAFAAEWAGSGASAALVTRGVSVPGHDPASRALLVVADADLALQKCLELFAPRAQAPGAGVHGSAVIEEGAEVSPTASIGPWCIVGAGAKIGEGAALLAHVSVGRGASVGAGTVLHAGVVVGERCSIGSGCTLWANAVIGADGFGYLAGPGAERVKVPHIGTVEIGDRVEIGANSCVDRAKFGATVIGEGTKIDNLVQIGHNCQIGRSCIICGQCGLAGSVTLGDGAMLGGSVVISDGVHIGKGARVGGRSAVSSDIPPGDYWLGTPAISAAQTARNYAALRRIADHVQDLKRLQKLLRRKGILEGEDGEGE
jgi:UDP-3-O-[3-hydroxymyristoyl] glucosamine N-acyltransferase